uniref:Uncharacterized protein n=1 Tax=Anopheles merus TaxID=30066 RepID=A0A182VDF3_ANOME
MNRASRPSMCSRRRWCTPVSFSTFLEKMFCSEKPIVAISALTSPITSNDSSVSVAMPTPTMIGTSDRNQKPKRFCKDSPVWAYDTGTFQMEMCEVTEAKNFPSASGTIKLK